MTKDPGASSAQSWRTPATALRHALARAGELPCALMLGVSGGLDSTVLLDLTADWLTSLPPEARPSVHVVHIDHQLRGAESSHDAAFVQALAARYGLAFHTESLDVAELAKHTKCSIESAGRLARRAVFARVAKQHAIEALWLAHHADDQAETILWNLARGCGLHGVVGMAADAWQDFPEATRLRVMRPLLAVRRQSLEIWAQSRNLTWREDASNAERTFTRNRIRHDALPAWQQATGRDCVAALLRFADQAAADDAYLAQCAAEHIDQLREADGALAVPAFRTLHRAMQRRVLQLWLANAGVSPCGSHEVECALAVALSEAKPARANLPGARQVRRRAQRLSVVSLPPFPPIP